MALIPDAAYINAVRRAMADSHPATFAADLPHGMEALVDPLAASLLRAGFRLEPSKAALARLQDQAMECAWGNACGLRPTDDTHATHPLGGFCDTADCHEWVAPEVD